MTPRLGARLFYATAVRFYASASAPKRPFGFVYDERMLRHECPYDNTMAEKPERMSLIYERLKRDGLLKNAVKVAAREATWDELTLNHPKELIQELENIKTSEEAEEACRGREILWLSPESEKTAKLAAGGSIELVKANVEGRIGNGFAIVRPPGHHSWGKSPQGYCVYNNVALAAKYAVENLGVDRVAVIDFDIHPGNGTFYSLKGDERFFFSSLHVYHHGSFWPWNTDFDVETPGNNIFVPLNAALNTEGDFVGAFEHLILPALRDFRPSLILVSAGFDAALHDIMMELGQGVKAHGYGHMVKLLAKIAPDRVLAVLEGGYFPGSYVECASMMTRGLQKSEGLEEFVKGQRLFLGRVFREHWLEVLRRRCNRTREWFPELTQEQSATLDAAIQEYIQKYEWSETEDKLPEKAFLDQLLWTPDSPGEAFVNAAPAVLANYGFFDDYLKSEDGHFLICDRVLFKESKKKNP